MFLNNLFIFIWLKIYNVFILIQDDFVNEDGCVDRHLKPKTECLKVFWLFIVSHDYTLFRSSLKNFIPHAWGFRDLEYNKYDS